MKINKKILAGVMAITMMFSIVLAENTENVSAAAVKQIKLTGGKEKKLQLDNKRDEEKVLYTFIREKLSYDEEHRTTKYRIVFRLTINGETIIEESKTAWMSDTWGEEVWKEMRNQARVVITDIDKSDGRMDILVDTTKKKGQYRIQYANGKVVVKENLYKMAKSLKLPSIVDNNWGCDFTFSGTKLDDGLQPYYKNGEWQYDKYEKNTQIGRQLITKGDGIAKWVVCFEVYDVGFMHATIDLKLKNNKLQLATNSLSGDILETGFGKNGTAEQQMTVYTTPGGKQAAYVVNRGESVEFMSYKLINNKVYILVKNTKGKTGWISEEERKCLNFEGTLHA